jgi:hypothetical protein
MLDRAIYKLMAGIFMPNIFEIEVRFWVGAIKQEFRQGSLAKLSNLSSNRYSTKDLTFIIS